MNSLRSSRTTWKRLLHTSPKIAQSERFSFLQQIGERLRDMAKWPLLYQLRPEIGPEARMALFGRYAILFRVLSDAEETVRIERVVYGGRDLSSLFDPIH